MKTKTSVKKISCGFTIILFGGLFVPINGYSASCKLPKSYYKHVSCTNQRGLFLAVKDSGAPVALINTKGKKVVDLFRFDKVDATRISSGLMPVQRNNKLGYINLKGREVIPAKYDVLYDEAGKTGWARQAKSGRIVVRKNGKYGVIDTSNRIIIPFTGDFSFIKDVSNNQLEATALNNKKIWFDKRGRVLRQSGKTSDQKQAKNKPKTNNQNKQATKQPQSKTKSAVNGKPIILYPNQKDGKWGFIDSKQVTMITYSFDEVKAFSEGLAGVNIDGKWGFVTVGGELVIPFRFSDDTIDSSDRYQNSAPFTFVNGKAWVGTIKNGTKNCINMQGAYVDCDPEPIRVPAITPIITFDKNKTVSNNDEIMPNIKQAQTSTINNNNKASDTVISTDTPTGNLTVDIDKNVNQALAEPVAVNPEVLIVSESDAATAMAKTQKVKQTTNQKLAESTPSYNKTLIEENSLSNNPINDDNINVNSITTKSQNEATDKNNVKIKSSSISQKTNNQKEMGIKDSATSDNLPAMLGYKDVPPMPAMVRPTFIVQDLLRLPSEQKTEEENTNKTQ